MIEGFLNKGISTPLFQQSDASRTAERLFRKFCLGLIKDLNGVSAKYEEFLRSQVESKFTSLDAERIWISVRRSRYLATDDNLNYEVRILAQDDRGRAYVFSFWVYESPDGLSGLTSCPDYSSMTEADVESFHSSVSGQVRVCSLAYLTEVAQVPLIKVVKWLLRYGNFRRKLAVSTNDTKNLHLWHTNAASLVNSLYKAHLFELPLGTPMNHFSRILSSYGVYVNDSAVRSRCNLAKVFLSEARLKVEDNSIRNELNLHGGDCNGK